MNVTALVSTSGTVVERYLYDPYGKVSVYDGSWSAVAWANSKQNETLFCGYRFDPESGLYHVRRRPYHPSIGRFITCDPLGYVAGLSLCEYAMSSPIDLRDSFGLDAKVEWKEAKDPKAAQPNWVDQAELDKGVTEADRALGLEHPAGTAQAPVNPNVDKAIGYSLVRGCCRCWFSGTVKVESTYDFYMLNTLKEPKTEKDKALRDRTEKHERAHLEEDSAVPFRDRELQKPLADEVAAHSSSETAYNLSSILAAPDNTGRMRNRLFITDEQCYSACAGFLLGKADEKLQKMREAMEKRYDDRDDREYRDDARKRVGQK